MKTDKEQITSWIQDALDELYREHQLPFKLTAYEVIGEGREYIVPFHDARLHSVRFSWTDDRSFQEAFRAAVLERIEKMNPALATSFHSYLSPLAVAS